MKKALIILAIIFIGTMIFGSKEKAPSEKILSEWDFGVQYPADVVRVVDGDTLVVKIDRKQYKVRLIGIDAPESVKPNSPVECLGVESSQYTQDLLSAQENISLMFDESQGFTDKYDRLLGHVLLDAGQNLAAEIIRGGYAYEYTYDKAYEFQSSFKRAQLIAQQQQQGLWQPGLCN